ncbi:uncharacterized protein BDV14DRAFT_197142 [Aspergillus stella-maris]|uniref:uncharacterized protein n=1 Tax=Aspergillus stella-maris TaxID=1810926 RepID=UPI003CCDE19F
MGSPKSLEDRAEQQRQHLADWVTPAEWKDDYVVVERGNRRYLQEKIHAYLEPLLEALGCKGWGYTMWRFSAYTPIEPKPPTAMLVIPINCLSTLFIIQGNSTPPAGFDTTDTIEKPLLNRVSEALGPFFKKYARPLADDTLEPNLSLPTIYLQFATKNGKGVLIERAPTKVVSQPRTSEQPAFEGVKDSRLFDIKVVDGVYGSQRRLEVCIDGAFYFCKVCRLDPEGFEREVETLRAMSVAARGTARVPKLVGTNISEETRRKWIGQIQDTIDLLHLKGLAWGDTKAENVLIDTDQNVWVIYSGGRYTEGWVEKDIMESAKGDMQGLSKIKIFLNLA